MNSYLYEFIYLKCKKYISIHTEFIVYMNSYAVWFHTFHRTRFFFSWNRTIAHNTCATTTPPHQKLDFLFLLDAAALNFLRKNICILNNLFWLVYIIEWNSFLEWNFRLGLENLISYLLVLIFFLIIIIFFLVTIIPLFKLFIVIVTVFLIRFVH